MKIAVFEMEEWEREAFEPLKGKHDLVFQTEPLNAANAHRYADADVVSTFIYSSLNPLVLEKFGQLKLIATRSTGLDHIDGDYCRERGISVCNVPTYGDSTVAEHVFGLLLAISHNLVNAVDRTRRGDFSLRGLQGFDLRGKVLGVVGTGSIGLCVIEIANGFRMKVVAYDLRHNEQAARDLGFRYVEMDELLAVSDVITLHVPINPRTYHLISEDAFAKMKDGVVLINTSRGRVVDVQALVRAIGERKVAGAGLDVLPEEPAIREEAELLRSMFHEEHDLQAILAGHILLRLRNVIVTPHSAFYTREAVHRILETTVENIIGYVEGRPLNVVQ
ncbi:MAG TPA: hydroxyacid dehydrogenase [Chthonomonadales bacterium]|nr:hydroxyacid dehydrogenase [Chthonomonadales bacterium]